MERKEEGDVALDSIMRYPLPRVGGIVQTPMGWSERKERSGEEGRIECGKASMLKIRVLGRGLPMQLKQAASRTMYKAACLV